MDDFVDGASFLCFNLEFKAVDHEELGATQQRITTRILNQNGYGHSPPVPSFGRPLAVHWAVSVSRSTLGSPLDSEPAEIFPFPKPAWGTCATKDLANNVMGQKKTSGPEQGRSATGHRADGLATEDEHRQTVSFKLM